MCSFPTSLVSFEDFSLVLLAGLFSMALLVSFLWECFICKCSFYFPVQASVQSSFSLLCVHVRNENAWKLHRAGESLYIAVMPKGLSWAWTANVVCEVMHCKRQLICNLTSWKVRKSCCSHLCVFPQNELIKMPQSDKVSNLLGVLQVRSVLLLHNMQLDCFCIVQACWAEKWSRINDQCLALQRNDRIMLVWHLLNSYSLDFCPTAGGNVAVALA